MQKLCATCRFAVPITEDTNGDGKQTFRRVECRRYPDPRERPADYGCGEWDQRQAEQPKPPEF